MDTFLVIVKKTTLKWKQYSTTLEQKYHFSPNLGHERFLEVSALLDVRHCSQLQSCAI